MTKGVPDASSGSTPSAPKIDGFRYVKDLPKGGFARVYVYQEIDGDRLVAIKIAHTLSEEQFDQLDAEARIMKKLSDHPAIVPIYMAVRTDDGRPALVMQYFSRGDLWKRVQSNNELDVAKVLEIGVTLCGAVETAHRAGILHRDIKPANVLENRFGAIGLTDFGISVLSSDPEASAAAAALSIPWSPPEVVRPTGLPIGVGADVYSLGATLHTLLTGRSPFHLSGHKNRDNDLADRILHMPVPAISRPDVPPEINRAIAWAMSRHPQDRPSSAQRLAQELQSLQAKLHLAVTQPAIDHEIVSDLVGRRLDPGDPDGTSVAPQHVVIDPMAGMRPGSPGRGPVTGGGSANFISAPPPVPASGDGGAIAATQRRGAGGPSVDPAGSAPQGGRGPSPISSSTSSLATSGSASTAGVSEAEAGRGDGSGMPVTPRRAARRLGVPVVVGGLAATLVVAGVAAVVLGGDNGSAKPSDSASSIHTQDPVVDPVPVPDGVALSGAIPSVTVTWHVASPRPGDEYLVEDQNEAVLARSTKTSAVVKTLGRDGCVQVVLTRGGTDSIPSEPACRKP